MNNYQNQDTSNSLFWIVGIVAILALVIGWLAYNNSGEVLSPDMKQGSIQTATGTEQAALEAGAATEIATDEAMLRAQEFQARTEARADLIALQAKLQVEENYDAAATEVQSIRADLSAAYENASIEVKETWNNLDVELAQLEETIRTNSADALEVLAGFILKFEADVRVDAEGQE